MKGSSKRVLVWGFALWGAFSLGIVGELKAEEKVLTIALDRCHRYNKLDKEIDEARAEMDIHKRLKMYQAIQKKLMEDLPAISLFVVGYPAAHWPYIGGVPDRDPLCSLDFYS